MISIASLNDLNLSIVCIRTGLPAKSRNCLGISAPIRLPLPPATITTYRSIKIKLNLAYFRLFSPLFFAHCWPHVLTPFLAPLRSSPFLLRKEGVSCPKGHDGVVGSISTYASICLSILSCREIFLCFFLVFLQILQDIS